MIISFFKKSINKTDVTKTLGNTFEPNLKKDFEFKKKKKIQFYFPFLHWGKNPHHIQKFTCSK